MILHIVDYLPKLMFSTEVSLTPSGMRSFLTQRWNSSHSYRHGRKLGTFALKINNGGKIANIPHISRAPHANIIACKPFAKNILTKLKLPQLLYFTQGHFCSFHTCIAAVQQGSRLESTTFSTPSLLDQ